MDFSGILNYIFTQEHIATLLTIVIAIVLYELLKKGVRGGVGYICLLYTSDAADE